MRQSLLRDTSANSAAPGSPAYKVLLEQLNASCEELDVRKEEVLILRSQLVSQKEAMHHKVEEVFFLYFCGSEPVTIHHWLITWSLLCLEVGYKRIAVIHLPTFVCFIFATPHVCLFAPYPKELKSKKRVTF